MKKTQYIPVSPWRLQAMALFIALLFALLLWRVMSLQVLDTDRGYEFLKQQGEARFVRTAVLPAHRGQISDRRGAPVALSTPVVSIWAHPATLQQSGRVAELAQALSIPEGELMQRVERYAAREFMYLQRQLQPSAASRVLQLRIPGVRGEREYRRFYPAGEVMSHVVGMTNVDDSGIEGVELAYNDWLQGHSGSKRVIKNLHGEVVRDVGELEAAQPGKDLTLSIDLRLQHLAHMELQRAVALSGAKSASVVTVDVRSGEILAMVNHPVYNPNERSTIKPGQTRNRAMTDVFEPGSTIKPLTLLAAMESGLFARHSSINTSPGRVRVGRKTLIDPVNYGTIDLETILAKSSQVGVVKIALQLEQQAVWQLLNRFGLGQAPGTGFPGESSGVLPYRNQWRPIEQVTLAFGYGLTTTPVQLAQAYAIIANEGRRVPLSLLRVDDAPVTEQVVEPRLAREILQMLHAVTGDSGTGGRARVDGYQVAGKTGTVHKVAAGGYADDRYRALFAGMAPLHDPRLVTVVMIDEPQGDHYHGGQVAAPVFSRVTEGALQLLNIRPESGFSSRVDT